ncbi:ClpXP protease specificity-enhancing factor [Advenella sp. S44]|uniref:ClpXP protease specificity-enhancing factor n=1 Tax=Advenella sp. S44 TaxID=1982755 RepID=UPI000C2A33CA|nr:ClpXP protease specificity-enhancing factor [Advenella sp. S44]PJX25344.1 ClpXP protease specificity-enhancing factor [Advenella sp. S44]
MEKPSTKPYLLRAWHEWCTDAGYTPHLVVHVDAACQVPREFVRDERVTLNVGAMATNRLIMGNDWIEFQARFSGVSRQISVPVARVEAIYARETQEGMQFEIEDYDPAADTGSDAHDSTGPDDDPPPPPSPKEKAPWLKVVK